VNPRPSRWWRLAARTSRIVGFVLYFGWEFLLANLAVLREILTPRASTAPAVIEVRLRASSRVEMVSFANLITLTPGTLALEIVADPPILYVHGMFVHDPELFLADLRRLEDRMLAALRPADTPLERR
jgi:multicomponent Na+:H+ antiporter subunit E